jgi:L-ribulose-5-phosphate 3-epimerase
MLSRREFLAAGAAATVAGSAAFGQTKPAPVALKKAVKYAMIAGNLSVLEKFQLAKKCGFAGVEMDSPSGVDREAAKKAAAETGVVIHGVIDSQHWGSPLSHPDEKVRDKGFAALTTALEDAGFYGTCTTMLLVPGVVNKDVTYEQCWERSTALVKKALPLAEKVKVPIAIETVWNGFITKPEQMVEYVDQFKSPWVGAYFDISNMIKFGVAPADWVRKLGKRMLKFDFKGYSVALAKKTGKDGDGFGAKIGEGDEDWPEVLKAVAEVGYKGEFFTAEVGGGGEDKLMDISKRMDKILGK